MPSGLTKITEYKKEYVKNNSKLSKEIQSTIINNKEYKNIIDYKQHSKMFILPSGKTTTVRLDKTNTLPTRIQQPNRYDTLFFYNDEGRLMRTSRGLRVQSYKYDEFGNLSSTLSFPSLRKSEFEYNSMNQLTKQKFSDKSEAYFSYDANGNLLQVTTIKSNNHDFSYNKVDKLNSYETPTKDMTFYTYDKQRRLIATIKPSGKSIKNLYLNGKLISIVTNEDIYNFTYECDNIV